MKVDCDRCGKDMVGPVTESGITTPDGTSVAARLVYPGFSLRISVADDSPDEHKMYVQRQLGPYRINHEYRVCMECTLLKFGVTP
jgi:hypothetical protein